MDFFLGFNLAREQEIFLDKKKAELKPADYIGAKECQKSGFCCWQRPASVTQEDIIRISKHLKITPSEFLKRYCIFDMSRNDIDFHPRLNSQDKTRFNGKWLPALQTYNKEPCVFLDTETSLCKIHEVKPKQCVSHECWEKDNINYFHSEKTWEGGLFLRLYPEFKEEIEDHWLDVDG